MENGLHRWRRRSFSGLVLTACCVASGCATYGPDSMRASRVAYNDAVLQSEQRELLLNLVRMRYSETPEFLAISGISTQLSFEGRAALGSTFGRDAGETTTLVAPGVSIGYQENPTITFTPQRDAEFARQLLAPVEIDSLYLLSRQGWGIDRVLRLVAEAVNGVGNGTTREADSGKRDIELARFVDLVRRLRHFEENGMLRVALEQRQDAISRSIAAADLSVQNLIDASAADLQVIGDGDPPVYRIVRTTPHYVLQVDPPAWDSAEFRAAAAELGFREGASSVEIDPGAGSRTVPAGTLSITTRSVLAVLAYLSAGVRVPDAHLERGLAAPDVAVTSVRALLDVGYSADVPEEAWVAVPYRGYWFYIDGADIEAKRTYSLLTVLIRLSINAGGAQNVPVLTLPVAR